MTIEFVQTHRKEDISDFILRLEDLPTWSDALVVRDTTRRLISIRGRLLGETPFDFADIMHDLESFRGIFWEDDRVRKSLQTLVMAETAYYEYAERYASWCARDSGYPERAPDYKDVAKELVAWQVWYRWKPDLNTNKNGLHASITSSLSYLPQAVHKSYLSSLPFSRFFDGIEDVGDRVDFREKMLEMPEYRLRRVLSGLTLTQIFASLETMSPRERLAILCVMGYVDGVSNMTQGIKKFGVDTEGFRNMFERGLDYLCFNQKDFPEKSAREIVDEAEQKAVIRDPNGSISPFHSPRLILMEYDNPPEGMGEINEKIFNLSKQLVGNTLKYSLTEIGDMVGIGTKTAVAKRIKRIADALEKKI